MGERDPDFFKLHYRQWRRRMHKARVPYDLQGALLAIVRAKAARTLEEWRAAI